jgi:hypothetical protein
MQSEFVASVIRSFPPLRYAFAYGSAVFTQANTAHLEVRFFRFLVSTRSLERSAHCVRAEADDRLCICGG